MCVAFVKYFLTVISSNVCLWRGVVEASCGPDSVSSTDSAADLAYFLKVFFLLPNQRRLNLSLSHGDASLFTVLQ